MKFCDRMERFNYLQGCLAADPPRIFRHLSVGDVEDLLTAALKQFSEIDANPQSELAERNTTSKPDDGCGKSAGIVKSSERRTPQGGCSDGCRTVIRAAETVSNAWDRGEDIKIRIGLMQALRSALAELDEQAERKERG